MQLISSLTVSEFYLFNLVSFVYKSSIFQFDRPVSPSFPRNRATLVISIFHLRASGIDAFFFFFLHDFQGEFYLSRFRIQTDYHASPFLRRK